MHRLRRRPRRTLPSVAPRPPTTASIRIFPANYPTAINPATDGCRNITGRHNRNGTVTIFAVTSTVSANGDQGADPNKLVKVTDVLDATTLPTGDGDHDRDDSWENFVTIRTPRAGEVLRGVSLAPSIVISMITIETATIGTTTAEGKWRKISGGR